MWENERDSIVPITMEEALELWDSLPEKETTFEEAFPVVSVENT